MRYNKNNDTLELVAISTKIINLEGLRLFCSNDSQRYKKNQRPVEDPSTVSNKNQQHNKQVRSNKIYYKKAKQTQDQIYFSDYKIKYGTNNNSWRDKYFYQTQIQNNFDHKLRDQYPIVQPTKPVCQLQTKVNENKDENVILFEAVGKNQQNIINRIRKAATRMSERKSPMPLRISFSYKNYKKTVQPPETRTEISKTSGIVDRDQLDGWAIQSPLLYDQDKKLDITEYGKLDVEQSRQYFSERKKNKQVKLRYYSKTSQQKK